MAYPDNVLRADFDRIDRYDDEKMTADELHDEMKAVINDIAEKAKSALVERMDALAYQLIDEKTLKDLSEVLADNMTDCCFWSMEDPQ